MAKATTKASGRNIGEGERNTTAIKLRLDPDTAEELREFAEASGKTMAQVVDAAFTTIYRLNEGDLSKVRGQDVFAAFMATLNDS